MLRLQCLLSTGEDVHVVTVEVSPDERIGELQGHLSDELETIEFQAKANTVMKLYHMQQQRLTYRLDLTMKLEVLFLDGVEISGSNASSSAVLQSATQLVPWTTVSWYFQDQQFTFPDAVDIVVIWEDVDKELA